MNTRRCPSNEWVHHFRRAKTKQKHTSIRCPPMFVSRMRPLTGWGLNAQNRLSFSPHGGACGLVTSGLQADSERRKYTCVERLDLGLCLARSLLQCRVTSCSLTGSNFVVLSDFSACCGQIPNGEPYVLGNFSGSGLLSMTSFSAYR